MKVVAYAICWNEEKFLPYYLRWYTSFCDEVIIYDNYSTDKSHEIIKSFPRTKLRFYNSSDCLNDEEYIAIKNNCWKEDTADYVIVGDVDEILYHPYMLKYLEENRQYSIFRPCEYEMVAKVFPTEEKQIFEIVQHGILRTLNPEVNKKCIFDPKRIKEMNYEKGCHRSYPEGDINILDLENCDIQFLHYKWLDWHHVWNRLQEYKKRNILKDGTINNMAYHILNKTDIETKFNDLYKRKKKIL